MFFICIFQTNILLAILIIPWCLISVYYWFKKCNYFVKTFIRLQTKFLYLEKRSIFFRKRNFTVYRNKEKFTGPFGSWKVFDSMACNGYFICVANKFIYSQKTSPYFKFGSYFEAQDTFRTGRHLSWVKPGSGPPQAREKSFIKPQKNRGPEPVLALMNLKVFVDFLFMVSG